MSMNLEQIDELRKRANVSYEDAKNALEQNEGNMIDSLIYLEKKNKIKPDEKSCNDSTFFKKIKFLIKKGNETRLVIKKNDNMVLNICITLAVILAVAAFPVVIVALLLAIITNHKIRIVKKNNEDSKVNKIFDKVSVVVNNVTTKINEEMKTE